jgi:hypothetical protein
MPWPGGYMAFWLVINTCPFPAGGKNRRSEALSNALSNTSSRGCGLSARTACTDATGSRGSPRPPPTPSKAASLAKSASSAA